MKKIISAIFIVLFFLSAPIFSMVPDTLSGVWTESVKGESSALSQTGYVYGTTATSAVLSDSVQSLVSPIMGITTYNTAPRNAFSGTKFLVGVNVTTAYTDVAATLIVEGSGDGVTWATVATASSDATPNVTGVKWYLVDLTSVYLPYYRLIFNKGALQVNTLGKLKFLYALPQ